jgi:hypothetical protein
MGTSRLAVIVLSLGLVGCSSPPKAQTGSTQSLAERASLGPTEWKAIEETTKTCLAQQGFKYFAIAYVKPNSLDRYLTLPMSRDELLGRRRAAYGVAERQRSIVETQQDDANSLYVRTLSGPESKRYTALLLGDLSKPGSETCRKPLTKHQMTRMDRPIRIARDAKKRFVADQSVRSLGVVWKNCMSERGFTDLNYPWELKLGEKVDVMRQGFETALSEELTIARADVDCLSPIFDKLDRLRKKYEVLAEEKVAA